MSEEKDLVERLADLVKELPASLQPVVIEARGAIEGLRERDRKANALVTALDTDKAKAERAVKELQADNDAMRDRLFTVELHLAHLQGYRERVNEFDPVSEHAQYEDRLPRPRRSNDNLHGMAMMVDERDPPSSRAWYRRRRA